METWRAIAGYEGAYEVSDQGRVRSLDRVARHKSGGEQRIKGRVLKPVAKNIVYRTVSLSRNGKPKHRLIHQLVAAAFLGACPAGKEVAHFDGKHSNNKLGNLRYDTHAANVADAIRHGTHPRGVKHGAAKLTRRAVRAIRRLLRDGAITQAAIGRAYGVGRTTIKNIKCGRAWAWLA